MCPCHCPPSATFSWWLISNTEYTEFSRKDRLAFGVAGWWVKGVSSSSSSTSPKPFFYIINCTNFVKLLLCNIAIAMVVAIVGWLEEGGRLVWLINCLLLQWCGWVVVSCIGVRVCSCISTFGQRSFVSHNSSLC